MTTDLSAWWAPIGLWYLGAIAGLGFGACYVARSARGPQATRQYALQNA